MGGESKKVFVAEDKGGDTLTVVIEGVDGTAKVSFADVSTKRRPVRPPPEEEEEDGEGAEPAAKKAKKGDGDDDDDSSDSDSSDSDDSDDEGQK